MNNQSKYQVAIAATDHFSKPIKAASASFDSLTDDVKAQSAEIKKLKATAASLKTYADIKRELSDTSAQMTETKLKTKQLALTTNELSNQTLGYEAAVSQSEIKLEHLEAQMRSTERPTKALRLAVKESRKELKANSASLKEHQNELEKTQRAYNKSRNDVSQLNKHYDSQRTKLHRLKSELNESGIQASKFGSAQRQVQRDITAANAALDKQKSKLKAVSAASAKIESNKAARAELGGEALDLAMKGAVLAVPIKFAVDFESAFADVKKAVNDASAEELEVMRQKIVIEAPKLGVTQEGLSGIIAEGARNGIKKEELFDYAASAAKMSVAFDMTADEAGASMMKWRTTMNLSQDQAVNLANAVNYVGDNMATTAKDITEVLVRQGAVIKSAGLEEVQAASLSAAVLSGSASTEIAATATKNLLLSLTAGDAASGGQKEALTTLGFDPAELARDMQDNAPKTVERVLLAIKEQDADVQTALMKNLFGSESIGSIAPLLQNMDNFRKAFKLIEKDTNFAGSMQKEFDIQSATASRKISAFTASMTGLLTVIGESMLPVVGSVLDVITPAVTWLTEAAQSAPQATAALMAIPAALIAIKAGALAFKTGKLLLGQGKNYGELAGAKLGNGLDDTAESATKATSRLNQLSQSIDRLGDDGENKRTSSRQSSQREELSTTRTSRQRRSNRRSRRRSAPSRLRNIAERSRGVVSRFSSSESSSDQEERPKSKWVKTAAMLGGGTALSLMTANAVAAPSSVATVESASASSESLKKEQDTDDTSDLDIAEIGGMVATLAGGDVAEIGGMVATLAGGEELGDIVSTIAENEAVSGLFDNVAESGGMAWLGAKAASLFSRNSDDADNNIEDESLLSVERSATKATTKLNELSKAMDGLSDEAATEERGRDRRSRRSRRSRSRSRRRASSRSFDLPRASESPRPPRARTRRRGKLGRLLDFGSRAVDLLPSSAPPVASVAESVPSSRSKWGRRAAMLGGGTALSLMTANANAGDMAMMGADAVSMVGDIAQSAPLKGIAAGVAGVAGKLIKPLNVAMQGAALTSAIANGDKEEIGATAGDMVGGLGGAALGAAIGTAILPGVGTVIGGIAGSLAGGELGEWVGTKAAALFSSEKEDTITATTAEINDSSVTETSSESNATETLTTAAVAIGSAVLPGVGAIIGDIVTGGKVSSWVSSKVSSFFSDDKEASSVINNKTDSLERDSVISEKVNQLNTLPESKNVLPSPQSIQKSLTQTHQDNRKIDFHLTIPPSSGNAQQDEDLLNKLMSKLKEMMMTEGVMGSGELAIAMDGSLSDRSDV